MSNQPREWHGRPARESNAQDARATPIILAIETATRAGSVAISRGEEILASTTGDASSSHSTDLIENIDRILRDGSLELRDVDLFAAAIGPGSFTGLRIGLATVKSLAVATNKKCVGVSTLAAVAHAAGDSERTVALLPAGRGEVFAQMFSVIGGEVSSFDQAMHISPQTLLSKYGGYDKIKWAGEGAHAQLELLRAEAQRRGMPFNVSTEADGWSVAPNNEKIAESVAPNNEKIAESVALLGLTACRAGLITEAQELHADYVRPSDAELKVHA
jgi:tRNA threonylcarbamoyladenosine biosynthesis protein TsaB